MTVGTFVTVRAALTGAGLLLGAVRWLAGLAWASTALAERLERRAHRLLEHAGAALAAPGRGR